MSRGKVGFSDFPSRSPRTSWVNGTWRSWRGRKGGTRAGRRTCGCPARGGWRSTYPSGGPRRPRGAGACTTTSCTTAMSRCWSSQCSACSQWRLSASSVFLFNGAFGDLSFISHTVILWSTLHYSFLCRSMSTSWHLTSTFFLLTFFLTLTARRNKITKINMNKILNRTHWDLSNTKFSLQNNDYDVFIYFSKIHLFFYTHSLSL